MAPIRRSFAALAAGVLPAMLAFASLAQVEPRYPGVPNFHQINQQLYRGGQPKGRRFAKAERPRRENNREFARRGCAHACGLPIPMIRYARGPFGMRCTPQSFTPISVNL